MIVLLLSLAVLLVLGIPIAYAIGLSSLFFFALNHPDLVQILPNCLKANLILGENYSYAPLEEDGVPVPASQLLCPR